MRNINTLDNQYTRQNKFINSEKKTLYIAKVQNHENKLPIKHNPNRRNFGIEREIDRMIGYISVKNALKKQNKLINNRK